jgi:hypothetical protein
MSRKFVGPLSIFLLAGASLSSTAQEPMPAPGASSYLAGTAESFIASCRRDLDDAKKRIATIKASQPPRDAWATLQAFDTAVLVAVDAENRAGLAEQVHPAKHFRDAACLPTSPWIKSCTTCLRRSMAPNSIPPALIICGLRYATITAPALTAMTRPGTRSGSCRTNW